MNLFNCRVIVAIITVTFLATPAQAAMRYCWIYENVVDSTGQTVREVQQATEVDEEDFRPSNLPGCQKSRTHDGRAYHFCSNYVVRIFNAETGQEVADPSYGWNCGKPPGKTANFGGVQTNIVKKGFRLDR